MAGCCRVTKGGCTGSPHALTDFGEYGKGRQGQQIKGRGERILATLPRGLIMSCVDMTVTTPPIRVRFPHLFRICTRGAHTLLKFLRATASHALLFLYPMPPSALLASLRPFVVTALSLFSIFLYPLLPKITPNPSLTPPQINKI